MKKEKLVTVKEVQELIRALGFILGLIEENQESSLESFVEKFSNIELEKASLIALNATIIENYIESSAQEKLPKMVEHFVYKTEGEVKDKLMKVESILVAVSIVKLAKTTSKEYIDWLFETTPSYIEENKIPNGFERLESVLNYLGRE